MRSLAGQRQEGRKRAFGLGDSKTVGILEPVHMRFGFHGVSAPDVVPGQPRLRDLSA